MADKSSVPITESNKSQGLHFETTNRDSVLAKTKSSDISLKTKLSSIDELKTIAPKIYNQIMVGLTQGILKEMRQHEDRLKELNRKMREGTS